MTDETTPPRGPENSTSPPAEPRPSGAETGWPAATPAPGWERVEGAAQEEQPEAQDGVGAEHEQPEAQDGVGVEHEQPEAGAPMPTPTSATEPTEEQASGAGEQTAGGPVAEQAPEPTADPAEPVAVAAESAAAEPEPPTEEAAAADAAAEPEPEPEPEAEPAPAPEVAAEAAAEPADAPTAAADLESEDERGTAATAMAGAEPTADAIPEPEPEPEPEPATGADSAVPVDEPTADALGGAPDDLGDEHGDEPVEHHGSDQDAAELAGAALFAPVPADVVPAQPTRAQELDEASDEADEEQVVAVAEPAVPGGRSATIAVALLTALVLVLAGLTAFLAARSVSTRGGGGVEDARHDGLQAARNAARVVFSYDYRHLDKDFAAGKALTTGTFADQYGTTTPKLVEVAKTYKAVVAADVSDAGVITASTGKVVVLVFVNQQSTSTLAAAPKITQSRVTMTMVHRGGRWLVSDVHAF